MNPHTPRSLLAVALLALSAVFLVTPASADDKPAPDKPVRGAKKYDADKDGQLSDEEKARMKEDAKAHRDELKEKALEKYDANKNGKLDPEEKAQREADRKAEKEKRQAEHEAKKAERDAKKAERDAKKAAQDEAKEKQS